jgi:hypothetical protein
MKTPSSTRKASFHERMKKPQLQKDGAMSEPVRLVGLGGKRGKAIPRLKVSRGRPAPAYGVDKRHAVQARLTR